jgi:GNAT superfamily N-acetyltransferase
VLIEDGWQRRGLGSALVRQLVARAVERGVAELIASVLPDRASLLTVLGRELERLAVSADDDYLTARYRLPSEVTDAPTARPA